MYARVGHFGNLWLYIDLSSNVRAYVCVIYSKLANKSVSPFQYVYGIYFFQDVKSMILKDILSVGKTAQLKGFEQVLILAKFKNA